MANDLKQSIRTFIETSFLFREGRGGLTDGESLLGAGLIDSTGIRVLWQAHQRSAQDGTRLSLIPGDGSVGRALQLTGLLEHMDLLER